MSTCKPVALKFPNNPQLDSLVKSHTKSGATVLKTGLAYLKKVFKHDPVDDPEIVRKKNNGTADGRFDPTGAKKYRLYTSGKGKPHKGVDLKGDVGDDIYAIACGTVDVARTKDPYKKGKSGGEYGKYVRIHHGSNIYSVYAHLSEISVKVGDKITFEDDDDEVKIGEMGKTGNVGGDAHLHFEIVLYNPKKHKKWGDRELYDPTLIFDLELEEENKETPKKPVSSQTKTPSN